jgi:hypothetical protein
MTSYPGKMPEEGKVKESPEYQQLKELSSKVQTATQLI